MQDEAIEVRRTEVLQRGLQGGLDLRGDVGGGIVWQGLVLVLAIDRSEPRFPAMAFSPTEQRAVTFRTYFV